MVSGRGPWTLMVMGAVLAGCVQTSYSGYSEGRDQPSSLSRTVQFDVTEAFYRTPPDCVIIAPLRVAKSSRPPGRLGHLLEAAAGRQASGKVRKVISGQERRTLERRLAFDFDHPDDRRRLARDRRCSSYLVPVLHNVAEDYALVWSQRSLQLGMELRHTSDDALLWRASHTVSRGDGGLPLSPLSLGVAVFAAARTHGDRDAMLSMIDDGFRRMLKSLPDTRIYK